MKKTKRQIIALSNPVAEAYGKEMTPDCHRYIGSYSTILTVDMVKAETGFIPVWRASVSIMLPKDKIVKIGETECPAKTLMDWDKDEWEVAIAHCEQMLKGVGEGELLWSGNFFSCDLYRGLDEADILSLPLQA